MKVALVASSSSVENERIFSLMNFIKGDRENRMLAKEVYLRC